MRILTWFFEQYDPSKKAPAFYMEAEYHPVAVRIRAETQPTVADAEFNIYADGVSLFEDHDYSYGTYIANSAAYRGDTNIHLAANSSVDEMAEDFKEGTIESGTWLTCSILKDGGGRNFTVQLELEKVSESDEDSD